MLILVDQDGVIANFDARLVELLAERHPEIEVLPLEEKRAFYLEDEYPDHRQKVIDIYTQEGFFLSLPPIEGAIEGMRYLLELGHDVRICTSPMTKNNYCLQEKWHWIRKHAPDFTKRLIVTKDKTLVRGDVLVDDKPKVDGVLEPEWVHVLCDQPYNRNQPGPRMRWDRMEYFFAILSNIADGDVPDWQKLGYFDRNDGWG